MYYGLNAVGARIWALLEEPRTVREVQERLVDEFRVDPDRCSKEVGELLASLVGMGLVRRRGPETTVGNEPRPRPAGERDPVQ